MPFGDTLTVPLDRAVPTKNICCFSIKEIKDELNSENFSDMVILRK